MRAAWGSDLLLRLFAVCMFVWVWVRLACGRRARCAAELTPERAGGGEDKKARPCRDRMTLC